MSDARLPTDWRSDAMRKRIRKRYTAERNFKAIGLIAILLSAGFLAFLLITMASSGLRGFTRSYVAVPFDFPTLAVPLSPAALKGGGDLDSQFAAADLPGVVNRATAAAFGPRGAATVSDSGWLALRDAIARDPSILSRRTVVPLPASPAMGVAEVGEGDPALQALYRTLESKSAVSRRFDTHFLTASDATDPTQAGIWGAFKGSLLTMLVTLALAFPIGVLSAIYLEEYAPKNRWTDLIEVSINNLAAVPSIIFGLLGLAVFLNTFDMPRSAPLVGGLTLALMTMPVIVIAGRNAIKSVPPSIRDAALGIGASPIQVVFHHVLPLALPGILTGTIIGMARALGETAPLLMIGMRAFVATPPGGITDPSSVLPVQIFLWSDEISRGFIEKTSAAIIVLLAFLLAMNGAAIYLRNKFETRW
jgi:phosphate transport system permease protein